MIDTATIILALLVPLAQPNLVANGSFEVDADGDGVADGWSFVAGTSADKAPKVSLSREPGKVGQWCQRITCSQFQAGHVMLAQIGHVSVEAGKRYKISFWARGEGVWRAKVALKDRRTWRSIGLEAAFRPTSGWRKFTYSFTCDISLKETSRLQFWFLGTGTLWLDDVVLVESEGSPPMEYIGSWPQGRRNAVVNSSFELGAFGWFTEGYWKLLAEVTTTQDAPSGQRCLLIRADRRVMPVLSFDYYEPSHHVLETAMAATKYWIRLDKGATYTLSAYVKVSAPITVTLGLKFPRGTAAGFFPLRPEQGWVRLQRSIKARADKAYVLVGPQVPEPDKQPASVWVDAVQLEKGEQATDYQPRHDFEIAAYLQPWRQWKGRECEAARVRLVGWNCGPQPARTQVRWRLEDFWGRSVAQGTSSLSAAPGQLVEFSPKLSPAAVRQPFLRFLVRVHGEDLPQLSSAAVLSPSNVPKDSAFGINHAFPCDEWLRMCQRIGITWVRDWTLKWQYVEPEKDKFELEKADYFINRPLKLGMNHLCMFPFPSSIWDAEQPPKPPGKSYKSYRPWQIACRPKDIGLFRRYIRRCVERYKDRIKHWEIFNESFFTTYSLPSRLGYTPADYVPLLKAAWEAIKSVDPGATVIGGYSAPPGYHMSAYDEFIKVGGLRYCDAVSIHEYPGGEPEGCEEPVRLLNGKMRAAGRLKPLWLTEFAYYADDDLSPGKRPGAWPRLAPDELAQSAWTLRYCLLMLSSNVERIFFHIWRTRVNFDGGQGFFFEADFQPHKVACVLPAMVRILGPQPKFVAEISMPADGQRCLIFRSGNNLIGVIWDGYGTTELDGPAPKGQWYDIIGHPLAKPPGEIGPCPVYVISRESLSQLSRELARWTGGKVEK